MATITQQDIDSIVNIQTKITPMYHINNDVSETTLQRWLASLTYLTDTPKDGRTAYIVYENRRIIGIDTLSLLMKQYDVADPSQLIFNNLKLGGALLKDARGVVFTKCDFTYCHHLKDKTSAFIRTNHDRMNDFTQARFIACDLHEVLFKNVTLSQASFSKTQLSATQFLYSDLANCDFDSITFTRAPRFVHTNLYHSHAHLHPQNHAKASEFYDKTALVGGLLISTSAILITLMMFDIIPSITAITTLSVGLLVSGIVLGYLGAASAHRQQSIAQKYELFENTVVANSDNARDVTMEKIQQSANEKR